MSASRRKKSDDSKSIELQEPKAKKPRKKIPKDTTAELNLVLPQESESVKPQLEPFSYSWVLKDSVLIFCILFAVFLTIVLVGYNQNDPGFTSSAVNGEIHNLGGKTGAWLSSFLLYIFGVFAYLIPVGILLAGWFTLRLPIRDDEGEIDYYRFFFSILGVFLMVSAGSAMANLFLHPETFSNELPFSPGGIWGGIVSNLLIDSFDLLATTLMLLGMFALSISLLLSQSWMTILEVTGKVTLQLLEWVANQWRNNLSTEEKRHAALLKGKQRLIPFRGKVDDQPEMSRSLDLLPEEIEKESSVSKGPKILKAQTNQSVVVDSSSSMEEEKPAKKLKLLRVLIGWKPQSGDKDLQQVTLQENPIQKNTANVAYPSKRNAITRQSSPDKRGNEDSKPVAVDNTKQAAQASDDFSLTPYTEESLAQENAEPPKPSQRGVENHSSPREDGTSPEVKAYQRDPSAYQQERDVQLPSVELLDPYEPSDDGFSEEELTDLSFLLEQRLQEFGVKVTVESVQPGPVVTRFEILPAPGVKVSQINNLAKDLARVLSVKSVRVVDVIPGKSVVGIEIPNEQRDIVSFRDVLSSGEFAKSKSPLSIAIGKDISGKPVVADIAKMPHLLVAGTTGAGKSVGVNSMILSMLYKSTPEQVRLIMIDPKMLELSVYDDIPHLLTPVVTDMNDAANALRWCVFEMDRRYQLMAKMGVRNIAGFNMKVQKAIDEGNPIIDPLHQQAASYGHTMSEAPPTLVPLPYIVVVVDEFADMIMVVGKEVEQLIARIAQKARAAGIHLILATQRPSVNVITGLIKANIPTRISFMVNTKIDSRTILDQGGAEQLLGMGDMLYLPPGSGSPKRVHGAFVSDEEVIRVAEFVRSQGEPQYLQAITQAVEPEPQGKEAGPKSAEEDPLYDQIVNFAIENRKVSVSLIQRQFSIGYNRSARIVEAMEKSGLISTSKMSSGQREVLVGADHSR